eukprot:COSAG02_NODE_2075_length_9928_cov_9.770272_1_plen_82_part_00
MNLLYSRLVGHRRSAAGANRLNSNLVVALLHQKSATVQFRRQTGRQTDRQTGRQADRQAGPGVVRTPEQCSGLCGVWLLAQ